MTVVKAMIVFGYDPKRTDTKSKNKQMSLYQTKNHLHSKENNQNSGRKYLQSVYLIRG
jgi:hypothetical protein